MKLKFLSYAFILYTSFSCGKTIKEQLQPYLEKFDTIDGWFDKNCIDLFIKLNEFQKKNNIKGNLAEIGVYQGKSFIPLYMLAEQNDLVLAVDCFDDQQYNYDQSGPGCRYDVFMKNLKNLTPDASKCKVLKCDSSKKTTKDYLNICDNKKKFRMFSIDGCHLAKETLIDLTNATQGLVAGGFIIVDDYFNKDWPQVSEGVNQFLLKHKNIKPFFIGFNKVLLTHASFVPSYIQFLKEQYPLKPKREYTFYNSPVLIYE